MLNTLMAARGRITDPNHWGQDYLRYNNEYGIPAECARGAILSAMGVEVDDGRSDYKDDIFHCQELVRDIPNDDPSLTRYPNDSRATVATFNNRHSHADVLALFDRTIARLQRQQKVIDDLLTPSS